MDRDLLQCVLHAVLRGCSCAAVLCPAASVHTDTGLSFPPVAQTRTHISCWCALENGNVLFLEHGAISVLTLCTTLSHALRGNTKGGSHVHGLHRQVLERRDDAHREVRGCIFDGRIGGRPECIRIPSPVVGEDRDSR